MPPPFLPVSKLSGVLRITSRLKRADGTTHVTNLRHHIIVTERDRNAPRPILHANQLAAQRFIDRLRVFFVATGIKSVPGDHIASSKMSNGLSLSKAIR